MRKNGSPASSIRSSVGDICSHRDELPFLKCG